MNQIARDRAWEGPLDSGTGAFVKVSASNINGSSKLSSSACENEEKEREKKDGGGLACKTAAATATSTSKRSSNASITAGSSNSLLSPTSTSATSSTYSSATLDVLFIHSDAIFIRVSYDENPADVAHTSTPLKDIVTLKSYFSSRIQTSSSTTNTAISSTTSSSNARLVQLVDMNSLVLHHAFPGDAFTQLSGTHLQQQQQSLNFSNIWNLDFQFSLMITNKWKLDRTQQGIYRKSSLRI